MAKAITDDELKALIDGEMRQAVGFFGGRLANMRQKALIYYEGLPEGDLSPPEVEGRSSVIATEVRNVVQSILPTLMEKFSAGEDVVVCEPTAEQDEQAAKDATDYLNYLFYKQNNGHKILETAFLDGMISKCGFVKVWWDNRDIETKEEYSALTDVELAEILDDEEVEPLTHNSYEDEEAAEQKQKAVEAFAKQLEQAQADAAMNPQAQQAIPQLQAQMQQIQAMPVPKLHDITVKRVKKSGKLTLENVPPEELMISRKMKSLDWEREPSYFAGHRVARTQSELQSMGYKNVEQITSDDNQNMFSMERIERLTFDDDMAYMSQTDSPTYDPTQRLIWVTEAYLKADIDGDGIANLVKVTKAGNAILDVEEIDFPPFVMFRPIVMPHRFFGLSIADLAMEPQRVKTNVLRAMLDNLHFQTNGRFFAVEGQVNLDDLLVSRPGGVVRIKAPGAVGRLDQGAADSSGAMNMLQYMQGFTEESTGWQRTSQLADNPNSLNDTATAATIASNKANQRVDMIARNLAEGVVDLFRLMLKLILQNQKSVQDVKLGKGWTKLDPREWKNQFSLTINVGLGTGNKDQQVAHLNVLMQHQAAQLQAGIGTIQPENVYNASTKLANALGFKQADIFFTDPTKNPPQPHQDQDMVKMQMQAKEDQMKFQAQTQVEYAKQRMDLQLKAKEQEMQHTQRQAEIQMESQRDQLAREHEAQVAAMKASYDHQLEQQRLTYEDKWKMLDAEVKLTLGQIAATKGADGETTRVADTSANELLQAIVQKITAPKMIVRDENGRAIGIQ